MLSPHVVSDSAADRLLTAEQQQPSLLSRVAQTTAKAWTTLGEDRQLCLQPPSSLDGRQQGPQTAPTHFRIKTAERQPGLSLSVCRFP